MKLDLDGSFIIGDLLVEASMTASAGEIVAIVGNNGCGKTSLLHLIAGLLRLDAGRMAFHGEAWDDRTSKRWQTADERRVGMVFQQDRLFPHLTATENVAFGLRARGKHRNAARTAAIAALEAVDLGDIGDDKPGELSGGQRQRVALARALVTEPTVLLLDEPFASVDTTAQNGLRTLVRHAVAPVRIMVTHDPGDIHALADRVLTMHRERRDDRWVTILRS